jgi:predicted nucleic acid-binding Zn ribbon protein
MYIVMNLNSFEKTQQERIIGAEALGESEASFARVEMERLRNKLESKKRKQKKAFMVFGGLGAVIVVLIMVASYSQYKLYTLSKEEMFGDSGGGFVITASTTPEQIVSRLGRHVLIPEGDPQIAEVSDVEQLRAQQAFFKNAENGDIIILYQTMIYIYRPSKDIVVAFGDISGVGQQKP